MTYDNRSSDDAELAMQLQVAILEGGRDVAVLVHFDVAEITDMSEKEFFTM